MSVLLVERAVGRQLTEAERAIDIVKLDRALARAKDDLNAAIHAEMLRATLVWIANGGSPRLTVTPDMRAVLDGLYLLGAEEAWLELDRLGYDLQGRRHYIEEGPGDRDVPAYLTRNLRGIEIRIEDELVRADLSGLASSAVAHAVMQLPGARDLASRAISTAMINGFASTFDQVQDLIDAWQYTAILDGGTCDICRPLDGTVYETLEQLFVVLPNYGPNPRCFGGGRCRCRAIPMPADGVPPHAPYADGFALPTDHSFTRGEIRDAISAANSLHRLPSGIPPAKVVVDPTLQSNSPGFYDLRNGELHISTVADTPSMTFLHEAGHYLSHRALGTPGTMGALAPEMAGWLAAVGRTDSVQILLRLLDLDTMPLRLPTGETILLDVDHGYVRYALNPEEIWARSYAQWVALRTGDAKLLRELDLDAGQNVYPMQWDDADFEAVARAIDELMETLGWTT